jgi:hypothetical protein
MTLVGSNCDKKNETRAIAAPLASHFSCWRRSPVDRRQLSTWWATNDSQMITIGTMTATAHAGG